MLIDKPSCSLTGLMHPIAIDLDWRARSLYVLDLGRSEILACGFDGNMCATLRTGMDDARALILHPIIG